MPSRRTLLTGAAAASASALAGCAALDGGDSLRQAEHGDDPRFPDDARGVAADETWLEAHPNGTFAILATAFERERADAPDVLLVDTDLRLIPGRNQSSNDWTMAGFTLEHDYGALEPAGPVDRTASYVPAGADGGAAAIRMGADHHTDALDDLSRWRVRYDRNGSTWGPTFRTLIPVDDSLAAGDALASARLWARTRKWPFGSDERKLAATLVYGEDRRE
jgi:hypothetical protein